MVNYVIKNNLNDVKLCDLDIDEKDNWINCNLCKKWRKLPIDTYFEFKDNNIFICNQVQGLNCNIPEEKYTEYYVPMEIDDIPNISNLSISN